MRKFCYIILTTLFLASVVALQAARATTQAPRGRERGEAKQPEATQPTPRGDQQPPATPPAATPAAMSTEEKAISIEVGRSERLCTSIDNKAVYPDTNYKDYNSAILAVKFDKDDCWRIEGIKAGTTKVSFPNKDKTKQVLYTITVKPATEVNLTIATGATATYNLGGGWWAWKQVTTANDKVATAKLIKAGAEGLNSGTNNCVISGVGKGTTTITAQGNTSDLTKKITINVTEAKIPTTEINFLMPKPNEKPIEVGQSARLCTNIDGEQGSPVNDQDASILAVRHDRDACWRITGIKAGTTKLSVLNPKKTKRVLYTIEVKPATKVNLTIPIETPTPFNLGSGYDAWKEVTTANDKVATAKLVKAGTTNNCVITGVGAGTTTITAQSTESNVKKVITVNVTAPLKPQIFELPVEINQTTRVCSDVKDYQVYKKADPNIVEEMYDGQGQCFDLLGKTIGETTFEYVLKDTSGSIIGKRIYKIKVSAETNTAITLKAGESSKPILLGLASSASKLWDKVESGNKAIATAKLTREGATKNLLTITGNAVGETTITASSSRGGATNFKKAITVTVTA